MKSHTLLMYRRWLDTATPEQVELVDTIFKVCEDNYENGGDVICECWDPAEIVEAFESVADAKEYIGLQLEQAMNQRWGEDDDPEVNQMRKFEENWKD